jgi:transposase InsO family protein
MMVLNGIYVTTYSPCEHPRTSLAKGTWFVHHSARGSQYLSIKYTKRLSDARIEPSVETTDYAVLATDKRWREHQPAT